MKKYTLLTLVLITLLSLQSCAAIGDIFKTGMWFGVILVVAVVVLVVWLFSRGKN